MARWELSIVVIVAFAALLSSAEAQITDGMMGNPGMYLWMVKRKVKLLVTLLCI